MKLDYDLIKAILEYVESKSDGFTNYFYETNDDLNEIAPKWTADQIAYHLRLLCDEDFINGQIGMGAYSIIDLSLSGHQLLEAMRSNTLWNKIKSNMKAVGVESLKQIPGLALKLLVQ